MRSSTDAPRALRAASLLLAAALLSGLAGLGGAAAQATGQAAGQAAPQAGARGLAIERAWLDLGSAATGAVLSALHPRLGIEARLSPTLKAALESGLYYSAPADSDISLVQVDMLGLLRWRPRQDRRLSLAAGLGALYLGYGTRDGTAIAGSRRLEALVAAEAAWTWRLFRSPLYLEPALRGNLAAWAGEGGLRAYPSVELALRAGWRFKD
jgi:hypothetical protein